MNGRPWPARVDGSRVERVRLKMNELRVPPPDMRDEERRREAEILKKASSEELQKMFEQVSSTTQCSGQIVS